MNRSNFCGQQITKDCMVLLDLQDGLNGYCPLIFVEELVYVRIRILPIDIVGGAGLQKNFTNYA